MNHIIETGRTPKDAAALGKASFRSNLLVVFEWLAMARLLKGKGIRVEERLSTEAEIAFQELRSGKMKKAFAVSGHTGAWELLGSWTALQCAPAPLVILAQTPANPVFKKFLIQQRRRFGIHLREANDFLRGFIMESRNHSTHLYTMLCDMHMRGGIRVPFLGRSACTPNLVAALVLKYRVPLLLGRCVRRSPGDYLVEFEVMDQKAYTDLPKAEAVREMIAAINRHIGQTISMAPEQWIWAYRRFRGCCREADPDERSVARDHSSHCSTS